MFENKLKSFKNLDIGWNFGEGNPPCQETIDKAIKVLNLGIICDLKCEVFPVGDGEIEVSLYQNEDFFDILIKNDLTMEYTHEFGIGKDYIEIEHIDNISIEEIIKKIPTSL